MIYDKGLVQFTKHYYLWFGLWIFLSCFFPKIELNNAQVINNNNDKRVNLSNWLLNIFLFYDNNQNEYFNFDANNDTVSDKQLNNLQRYLKLIFNELTSISYTTSTHYFEFNDGDDDEVNGDSESEYDNENMDESDDLKIDRDKSNYAKMITQNYPLMKIRFKYKPKIRDKQDLNGYMHSAVYHINIHFIDINKNFVNYLTYIDSIIMIKKSTNSTNENLKHSNFEFYETLCKSHSIFNNEHIFLFLSNPKLIDLIIKNWKNIPVFVINARNFNQYKYAFKLEYDPKSVYYSQLLLDFSINKYLNKIANNEKSKLKATKIGQFNKEEDNVTTSTSSSIILSNLCKFNNQSKSISYKIKQPLTKHNNRLNILLVINISFESYIFNQTFHRITKSYKKNLYDEYSNNHFTFKKSNYLNLIPNLRLDTFNYNNYYKNPKDVLNKFRLKLSNKKFKDDSDLYSKSSSTYDIIILNDIKDKNLIKEFVNVVQSNSLVIITNSYDLVFTGRSHDSLIFNKNQTIHLENIYYFNSVIDEQISKNFQQFFGEFLYFAKTSYETYLEDELRLCFNHTDKTIITNETIIGNWFENHMETHELNFKKIVSETYCYDCTYMKSLNKHGYFNEPSYFIYRQVVKSNGLVSKELIENIRLQNYMKKNDFNEQSNKTVNIQHSSTSSLNRRNYYIVTTYLQPPYLFVEPINSGHESTNEFCNLGMICYETNSTVRLSREFFSVAYHEELNRKSNSTCTNDTLWLKIHKQYLEKHNNFEKRCCYGISISVLNMINDRLQEEGKGELKLYIYALKKSDASESDLINSEKKNFFSFSKKASNSSKTSSNPKLYNLIDEVIFDLYIGEADFSIAPIGVNRRRQKYVDFAPAFYHDNYVLISNPNREKISLTAFFAPFEWSMWLGVFVILNIAAVIETFYEWHSPYGLTPRGRNRNQVWSLASALTLCWSVIFSHTMKTKSPKCWSNRFLGNLWGCFAVIFIASYTANLAAVMVGSKRINQIKSISDPFLIQNNYRIGIVANSSTEEFIQKSIHYSHIYSHVHKHRYGSSLDVINALISSNLDFAIMEHSIATYYLLKNDNKSIEIIGQPFGNLALAFTFSKESSIYDLISSKIMKMINDNTIEKSLKDWFMDWKCEKPQVYQPKKKYGLETFSGVFILLSTGILVGVIILIVEWIVYNYGVPYFQNKNWKNWLCFSQRLHWAVNLSEFQYRSYLCSEIGHMKDVGERLYNYTSRNNSVDFDMPSRLIRKLTLIDNSKTINYNKIKRNSLKHVLSINHHHHHHHYSSKKLLQRRVTSKTHKSSIHENVYHQGNKTQENLPKGTTITSYRIKKKYSNTKEDVNYKRVFIKNSIKNKHMATNASSESVRSLNKSTQTQTNLIDQVELSGSFDDKVVNNDEENICLNELESLLFDNTSHDIINKQKVQSTLRQIKMQIRVVNDEKRHLVTKLHHLQSFMDTFK